jgi:glutamine amidotransferase
LRSVAKALEHASLAQPNSVDIQVTADPKVVAAADRVVVPGQGAMGDCMAQLSQRGLREAVIAAAANKPLLGICIGLQMLFEHSEEGNTAGLGIFPGRVQKFAFDAPAQLAAAGVTAARLKIPHMGWNQVRQTKAHPMWHGIADRERFYFVHSYYVASPATELTAGTTDYGFSFTSACARANIFSVQFHPEKSARAGLQLLNNFISWTP